MERTDMIYDLYKALTLAGWVVDGKPASASDLAATARVRVDLMLAEAKRTAPPPSNLPYLPGCVVMTQQDANAIRYARKLHDAFFDVVSAKHPRLVHDWWELARDKVQEADNA